MKEEKVGAAGIYLAPETIPSNEAVEENNGLLDEVTTEDVAVMVKAEPKTNVRMGEILDLREGNRKVYLMSDGSKQAVFYPETVHVFDEDINIFDDVDNTLAEEEDGRHFVSGKNRFKVRFSREEENDELFSIESGMHRVTVSAKKNSKQRSKRIKPRVHKKMFEGIERTDALVFAGIQDGSDYEYSVTGNGVKENIVVKEKTDVYRYPFIIRTENVTAEFDESNTRIAFISNETGKEVFLIPVPFMTDGEGVTSAAVSYEVKNAANGDMLLNIVADSEWMNAQDRIFPVVVDTQIQVTGQSAMSTYSWDNGSLYNASLHTVGTTGSGDGTRKVGRMYMSIKMPTLPHNPRIKKAELKFFQKSSSDTCCDYSPIGLYRVIDMISAGICTLDDDADLIDCAGIRMDPCEGDEMVSYTFDVTTLVDQVNKGDASVKNLVLKMIDETPDRSKNIVLYGSGFNSTTCVPRLIVTYESSYGVNTSYRTHTHELGRFGQGSIDLQCGNLMFESEDFAWIGNRMPVTIKHLYNSALDDCQYTANSSIKLLTADFSSMKLGNGFKLNVMQSMMHVDTLPIAWTEEELKKENMKYDGYVYIGENGEETYFKKSEKYECFDKDGQRYHLYEDVKGGDMLYDPVTRTLKQGEDTYEFDDKGRLVKITDAADNHMDITYTADRITCVTDGEGRNFWLTYSGDYLISVTAPDNTKILYTYSDNLLTEITYPDGQRALIVYGIDKLVAVIFLDAMGYRVYKVQYTFNNHCVASVTRYGTYDAMVGKFTYDYSVASGRTIVETIEPKITYEGKMIDEVIKTVFTFDDEGNIVSKYHYSQDI